MRANIRGGQGAPTYLPTIRKMFSFRTENISRSFVFLFLVASISSHRNEEKEADFVFLFSLFLFYPRLLLVFAVRQGQGRVEDSFLSGKPSKGLSSKK